uniref:Uncharacterized protein n=1 Tax=Anguilla anguilla TaxID=7936 RepID=A0A0E9V4U2_ANGAN
METLIKQNKQANVQHVLRGCLHLQVFF